MSLRAFEQAWLELLFNAEVRAAWQNGDYTFNGLNPGERRSLQQLHPETLERLVIDNNAHRQWLLLNSLPVRVRQLLGESHSEAVIASLLASEGGPPPLYPPHRLRSALLQHTQQYFSRHHLIVPHLQDLLSYELAATHLGFFGLPRPLPATPGPQLADWARLVRLGHQFPLVLESLSREQAPPDVSETPKQIFLLVRDFRGLRLENPHPLVARCLEACDGQQSWQNVLEQVLADTPDIAAETEKTALQEWLGHYLQRGVLVMSQG